MPILDAELNEILRSYPNIKIKKLDGYNCVLLGTIYVNCVENDFRVSEGYSIKIDISKDYPLEVPSVYEVGDKIPIHYNHKYRDHKLCLGTDIEIFLGCKGKLSIKFLIENYVKPYMFSYKYFERFKEYPFGERSHNRKGLIEGYSNLFGAKKEIDALYILKNAVTGKYRGHRTCVCGSEKKIRNCHPVPIEIIKMIESNPHIKSLMKDDFDSIVKR